MESKLILEKLGILIFRTFFLFLFLVTGCSHTGLTTAQKKEIEIPRALKKDFDCVAVTPGKNYFQDPSEIDYSRDTARTPLVFAKVFIQIEQKNEKGKELVTIIFTDSLENKLSVFHVNLLDLIPKVPSTWGIQLPNYLLAEYERFGVLYSKDENEFVLNSLDTNLTNRVYQVGLFNNCLDPGKWEMVLYSKYYNSYDSTHASMNQNQRFRVMAHTWFQFDKISYFDLLTSVNKNLNTSYLLQYDSLSSMAENIKIPFDSFGKNSRVVNAKILEIGNLSNRELYELDDEESYKYWRKLIFNRSQFHTYGDLLNTPVMFSKFVNQGFYSDKDTAKFDYSWLKKMDKVSLFMVDTSGIDRFIQMSFFGDHCRYKAVLGNFDLAKLNSGKIVNIPFGYNPMPKSRLNRKGNYDTGYNLGLKGKGIYPYFYLVDAKTGNFVNNQKLGLEQLFVSWQSAKRDALVIYLVSYERMVPIWMIKIGIPEEERIRDRISNALYTQNDSAFSISNFSGIRKMRDSLRSENVNLLKGNDTSVMTFESYGYSDSKLHLIGNSVDAAGFSITSGGFLSTLPFYSIGSKGFPFTGSTALINGNYSGINYLSRRLEKIPERLDYKISRKFEVISIDLAPFTPTNGDVTFVGVRCDSSTVSKTFQVGPGLAPKKYYFGEDFKNVYSLRWISNGLQFDNIVLRAATRSQNLTKN